MRNIGRSAQISILVALSLLPALCLPINAQNPSKLKPRHRRPFGIKPRMTQNLPVPESSDWHAVGNAISFEPTKVILDEELKTLTEGGKRHCPQWSKAEGFAVTRALATIYKACPKLITDLGTTIKLRKTPTKYINESALHCYTKGSTIYFTDDFFNENKMAENNRASTTLNLCAALLNNPGYADAASHKDWLTYTARWQKAREFSEFLFDTEDLKRLDTAMANQIAAPTILAKSPQDALRQALASYILLGPNNSPLGCKKFIEAVWKTGSVSSATSIFDQAETKTLADLNSKDSFRNFALELLDTINYGNLTEREVLFHDFERLKFSKKFILDEYSILPASRVYSRYLIGHDGEYYVRHPTMAK